MPFIPADPVPGARTLSGVAPPRPPDVDPYALAGAAFRQDNTIVGIARSLRQEVFPPDPSHNPLDIIRGTKYEADHLDNFVPSQSEKETRAIMARIDQEEADQKILNAAGGAGTVASLVAGVLDPTTLLPAGSYVRAARGGYSALRSAASIGLAGMVQAGIQETALQTTHETRTPAEALMGVSSAALLSGLIGAGGARFFSSAERRALAGFLDHTRAEIEAHAAGQPPPEFKPEAAQPSHVQAGEPVSALPPELQLSPAAAGAAATDVRELKLKSYGFDKIPLVRDIVGRFSTTRRVLESQSPTARRATADLSETPYRFKENEPVVLADGSMTAGVATTQGPPLDRIAKMYIEGTRTEVADTFKKLFSEYRFGTDDARLPDVRAMAQRVLGRDEGKMTQGEFNRQVGLALQNGDRHEIPQVARAAQFVRERVFEPWKERAVKAGLLPEDVGVKTAESYFQRVWNKEAIKARRPEFVNTVVGWMSADQATKRQAQQRLSGLSEQLKSASERLAAIEKKLAGDLDEGARASLADEAAALTRSHDAIRGKIEAELAAWEGKSASEAKSALKAREKYAAERGRAEDAPRLTQADDAVDRVVKRILESDRELDVEALRARAHEIADRILGHPDGRLPYDIHMGGPQIGWMGKGGEPPRGALAARDFNIPDELIRDYLELDAEHVASMHLRTVIPDVLLTERFGDVNMTAVFKNINDEYAHLIDATKSERERVRLANEQDRVIRDLAGMRDRIRHVFGFAPDLRNAARVVQSIKVVNNLSSMGMATVSSLPDMAGAVFRHGIETTFKDGWDPFFRALSTPEGRELWGQAKQQWRAVGIGTETTIATRQHALDDVFDTYRPQTTTERTLQAVNDRFFAVNLLAPFTDWAKTISANVASAEILRATEAASKGKATARQIAMLNESGIDLQMAGRIWSQFDPAGEVRAGKVIDGVNLPNTADWKDGQARLAFEGAVARDVEIAVVTPGQEKPLWMSHPVFSLLGQFKTFTAAATERILIANLQRRDAQVLQGLLVSLGLGMISYKINSLLGGQPTSDRPQDWFKEAISRGGLLGWFEEGNALASKATRGGLDVYRLIGADKPLSRFASRSAADQLLGPTAGKIESIMKGAGALATPSDWTEGDTKAIRRLLPFQNLFFLRGLLNQAEAGFNNAFGIDMRDPAKPH